MGRPANSETRDTKAELLSAALELVQTRGYHAFSYQDLADRLEIKKASVHYYYPGKEDLGLGMIEHAYNRFRAWQEKVASVTSPVALLEAYFDYFAAVSGGGTKICPCGSMAAEWVALPETLRKGINRNLALHREWLKNTIERGQRDGVFEDRASAEEQAQLVYAGIQGAMQIARVQDNPAAFRAVTCQLLDNLRARDSKRSAKGATTKQQKS
jgi:TetR/AcrR family transcriptional repressor of nem operon